MNYNPQKKWSVLYSKTNSTAYPAEGVIRIFKGKFPNLNLKIKKNEKILDTGFGDGRHFTLFKDLGLKVYGCEISNKIISIAKKKFKFLKRNLKVGFNDNLNYKSNFFNYLLSWNSCYYMNPKNPFNFNKHVEEFSRVLKPNGILIISIPKKSCFIYKDSKIIKKGYRIIKNDYFKLREGQIMRCFQNKYEIENNLKNYFKNFVHSSIEIDWFGLNYHWHILIAKKK